MLSIRFTRGKLVVENDGITTFYPIPPKMRKRVQRLKIKSYQQSNPPKVLRKSVVSEPAQNVKFEGNGC